MSTDTKLASHLNRAHPRAAKDSGACADGALRQSRVEHHAVDHNGFDASRAINEITPTWRDESGGREWVEDGVSSKPELVERLTRQDAGAVNGMAHGFVLLEDDDVEAALAEQASGVQAGRAGADDDDVVHPA